MYKNLNARIIDIFHDIDIRFTSLCVEDLNIILELMGQKDRIRELTDGKYADLDKSILIADRMCLSYNENELLNVECESGTSLKLAVVKQNEYCLSAYRRHPNFIIKPIMFSIWPQRSKTKRVYWSTLNVYCESLLYSFNEIDGDEQLKILTYKTDNYIPLNRYDIMFLLWAAYTNYSLKVEDFLLRISKILNKALIKSELKKTIKAYHVQDCKRLVDKDKREPIWEEIEMDCKVVLDLVKEQTINAVAKEEKKKGIKQGKEEGIEQVAKTMKNKGYNLEEIKNCTGLTINEINNL